jgi:hypothetical protein
MKTTLDLPSELIQAVKLRALEAGVKLKVAMAELLRKGLEADFPSRQKSSPRITRHPQTGLPVIQCRHPASALEEMTPQRVAEVLVEQEVAWRPDPGQRSASGEPSDEAAR